MRAVQHPPRARPASSSLARPRRLRCAAVVARAAATRNKAEVVVRKFYDAVNARQLDAALACVDEAVLYEDLIYAQPFRGAPAFRAHLAKVFTKVPDSLQFCIDDAVGDDAAMGCTHVEINGAPFPFSRGSSLYRLGKTGGIVYARDAIEPASKPGDASLFLLSLVNSLFKAFPALLPKPDFSSLKALPPPPPVLPPLSPFVRPALWFAFAVYLYFLILGTELPGQPIWLIKPETLSRIADESLDFFFVTPILHDVFGVSFAPAPPVHPVDLSLFNFVNAWSLMWLGILATDSRAVSQPLGPFWASQMLLTNLFLLPWMATRAAPPPDVSPPPPPLSSRLPSPLAAAASSPLLGVTGGVVGALCVVWALFADPPGIGAGDLSDRLAFARELLTTDRVSLAFAIDCLIYSAAQAWMIGEEYDLLSMRNEGKNGGGGTSSSLPPRALAYVPFFGMAAWLALRPKPEEA